jgi:hypothetical protein
VVNGTNSASWARNESLGALLGELVGHVVEAARTDSAATGRPCRLRDAEALTRFLGALSVGSSQTRAASAACLSESVVRLWLTRQDRAVYGLFRQAVAEVLARRAARPCPPIQHAAPSAVERWATVLLETAPPAPRPAPETLVPLAHRRRWWNQWKEIEDLERLGNRLANEEAGALRLNVTAEMRVFGLVAPPTEPEL